MRQISLALALGAAFASSARAETLPDFVGETIVVTPTRVPLADVDAPFASEVHTRSMIEQSGAASLYDFLAQHTSVQVLPTYGNKFVPKIDMRGFGIGDGYQNIVVSLDGRRLNNIDMSSQLIAAIPLVDIDRIEITKGSGSVMFGDGATAGSIQIYTRPHQGASFAVSAGNYGAQAATATAGTATEKLTLSASADYSSLGGYSDQDISGHKDASSNRTVRGELMFRPDERVELGLAAANTRIDTRYVGPLALAEYNANPAQNSGNTYSHALMDSDLLGIGVEAELAAGLTLMAKHNREDKFSRFLTDGYKYDYDYVSNDLGVRYGIGAWNIAAGMQRFDGVRIDRNGWGSDNDTLKRNQSYYLQGQYRFERTTLSAGARRESVEYVYEPIFGPALRAEHDLTAWDIGINHRLDKQLSVFANFNRAFQSPDIDRFFNWGGTFNAFIEPAISRTVNLGLNHVTPTNRLKLAVFRSNINNEIYYYDTGSGWTSFNTNLDKTHKYGLELQDTWRVADTLTASLNYTWTRAIIDRENEGGGAYNGKELPGVPQHGVNLGLDWRVTPASNVNLTHVWRSQAWAADDFDNNNLQKQAAYQSTNLAYRYRYKQWEGFVAVDNVFAQSNGIWIRDDVIYPVNFTRNWRLGLKAEF